MSSRPSPPSGGTVAEAQGVKAWSLGNISTASSTSLDNQAKALLGMTLWKIP